MVKIMKFRIFDEEPREMRLLTKEYDSIILDKNGEIQYQNKKTGKTAELMQCTGIKDKNKKEIFVNDIVRVDYFFVKDEFDGFVTSEINYEGYYIGIVTYIPSLGFCLKKRIGLIENGDEEDAKIKHIKGYGKIVGSRSEILGNEVENEGLLDLLLYL